MKTKLSTLAAVAVSLSLQTQAADTYVFGFVGDNFSNDLSGQVSPGAITTLDFDLEGGVAFGGGVGVRSDFLGGSRFEIEASLSQHDLGSDGAIANNIPRLTTGSISQAGFHVNYLKELSLSKSFTSYAGIGIGFTSVNFEGITYGPARIDDNDIAFSWQAIAGVEYKLNETTGLYVEYNYHDIGDIDVDRTPNAFSADDINTSTVQAGLRFYF